MKRPAKHPSAQDTMLAHITGYWLSQLILVAARLGIADELAAGPAPVAALARRVGANATALRRVLRALASVGIFAETANGRYRLTPLAATLRSDVPGSLKSFACMIVDGYNWVAWRDLLGGVRTGVLPFERAHGRPVFDYLREHPETDREFSQAMASISGPQNVAVARALNFGRFRTVVDIGGAHGHLLAAILGRHRRVHGILYDQPEVVAGAAASGFVTDVKLAGRITVQSGNFFNAVPPGADAYLMKYILHDWTDDQCERILANCRRAMAPGGRVLVVDHVIRPGNASDFGKMLDINMLVITGGRERTKEEFATLFRRAGLRLVRVHPTTAAVSVLEAA